MSQRILMVAGVGAACFISGQYVGFGNAEAAATSVSQLAAEVASLRTTVTKLSSVLQITGTSVALRTARALTIDASDLAINAGRQLTVRSGQSLSLQAGGNGELRANGQLSVRGLRALSIDAGDLAINAGKQTTVRTGRHMSLLAGGSGELRANGPLSVSGTVLQLNNGKRPVSFQAARVNAGRVVGEVVDGSKTVLVP